MKPLILNRRQLYDLVWAKPMREVSVDLGISDVGLSKVCDRHRVPRQERGYWNRVQAGQNPKKTVFTEVTDSRPDRIEIRGALCTVPDPARKITEEAKAARRAASRPSTPGTASALPAPSKIHPSTAATARTLRKGRADPDGAIRASGEGLCGITVAAPVAERAILLADALAKALDAAGLVLTPRGNAMAVLQGPESAAFTLRENTRRQEHIPTEAEQAAEEKRRIRLRKTFESIPGWLESPSARDYPQYDTVFTGQLAFQIEGYADGVRRKWADGKTQVLEQFIDDIVTAIMALLAVRKAAREDYEERQRIWQEQERRRALAKLRQEREKSRAAYLQGILEMADEARRLRQWLEIDRKEEALQPSAQFERLVSWSRRRLEKLETATSVANVNSDPVVRNLFPEPDELRDPAADIAYRTE